MVKYSPGEIRAVLKKTTRPHPGMAKGTVLEAMLIKDNVLRRVIEPMTAMAPKTAVNPYVQRRCGAPTLKGLLNKLIIIDEKTDPEKVKKQQKMYDQIRSVSAGMAVDDVVDALIKSLAPLPGGGRLCVMMVNILKKERNDFLGVVQKKCLDLVDRPDYLLDVRDELAVLESLKDESGAVSDEIQTVKSNAVMPVTFAAELAGRLADDIYSIQLVTRLVEAALAHGQYAIACKALLSTPKPVFTRCGTLRECVSKLAGLLESSETNNLNKGIIYKIEEVCRYTTDCQGRRA